MQKADIWLRITRAIGWLAIAAIAGEGILSVLGYLPDIGGAAQITVLIACLGAGASYAVHIASKACSRRSHP